MNNLENIMEHRVYTDLELQDFINSPGSGLFSRTCGKCPKTLQAFCRDYDGGGLYSCEMKTAKWLLQDRSLYSSCPHCGRTVNSNHSYCPSCGARIGIEQESIEESAHEEVVRCCDCTYFDAMCYDCDYFGQDLDDSRGYCAWGKRRE